MHAAVRHGRAQGRGENFWAPGQNAAWAPCQMSSERYAEGVPVRQRRTHLEGSGGMLPREKF